MTNNILDEIYRRIIAVKRDNSSKGEIVIYYGYLQRDSIRAALRNDFIVGTIEKGVITHLFGCRCFHVAEEDHLNVTAMS